MLTWQPGSVDNAFKVRSREHTEIRQYVVVRDKPKENYSLCRGVAKTKVDPNVHAIIHTSAQPPPLLEQEPSMPWSPIKVIAKSPEEKLAPASRVSLGKTCSVEWNTKVKEIGKVDKDCLVTLISDWKSVMNA
ncbi:MAG: hypothetical protein Q9213_005830 [Squamulea squamosa]